MSFHQIKKILLLTGSSALLILISCTSAPDIEDVQFLSAKQKKFHPFSDKRSAPLIAMTERLDSDSQSFSGDFSIRIESGINQKEKINLDGRIFFSKRSGKIKIQLMDSLFGLIFSQVISSSDKIDIKSAGKDEIHSQPMDDIRLVDPRTKKTTIIPFPIIYYALSLGFSQEFKKNKSYFSPEENRVLVVRGKDEYQYVFSNGILDSLEFYSELKNIKAIATVRNKQGKNLHPPDALITKVANLKTDQETNLIELKFKTVKRGVEIPESVFRF
ncbi:MAG: hypothetical protein K8R21_12240 [Leptospira sp.]|nr:hypothetical protein [Leptospira sp.]